MKRIVLSFLILILLISTFGCNSAGTKSPIELKEFILWVNEVKTVLNSYSSSQQTQYHSVLGNVLCGQSEIGDRGMTEMACSSMSDMKIGSKNLVFRADWSMNDPRVWHADVNLKMIVKPDCSYFNSAIQVEQKENEDVIFCHCQMSNGDQAIIVNTKSDNTTLIAFVPLSFLERYPDYIKAVSNGIDK